jgi:hypothetical protein
MRRSLILTAAVSAVFVGARIGKSQVLFTTAADWGGSSLSNDPNQVGWSEWGDRGGDFPPNPSDNYADDLSFTGPDLDGSTINGLGNYDNDNDASGPNGPGGPADPNYNGSVLKSYAGLTSPGGSMEIVGYGEGDGANLYATLQTGEMLSGASQTDPGGSNQPFLNAITQGSANKGVLKISFTLPFGGTTTPGDYFITSFTFYSNIITGFHSGSLDPNDGTANSPFYGIFGDQPGSYSVLTPANAATGTPAFYTGYIPYNLAGDVLPPSQYSTLGTAGPYLQFVLDFQSGSTTGNVIIDDIEALPLNNSYSIWQAGSTTGQSWNTLSNWSSLGIPHVAGDEANFMGTPAQDTLGAGNPQLTAAAQIVTLDGAQTVGNLIFNNSNPYTIAAGTGGTLTMNNADNGSANINVIHAAAVTGTSGPAVTHSITAPVILASPTVINVNSALDGLAISGPVSGPGNLTLNGAGTVTLSGANSYGGAGTGTNSATVINNGTLVIAAAGALPAGGAVMNSTALDVQANSVAGQITGGGTLTIGPSATLKLATGSGASQQAALVINSGSTLDIGNNTFNVNYGTGTDPAATIRELLISGYNSKSGTAGNWQGAGINSSAAALNPSKFAVGYADGGNALDAANTGVAAGDVEIMYTVAGDANLSGGVDLSDLVIVASDFGKSGEDWAGGDVNYDGNVDLSDLVIVASNFGSSVSSVQASDFSSSFASEWKLALAEVHGTDVAVPEPTVLGLGVLGVSGLLARRRRGARA